MSIWFWIGIAVHVVICLFLTLLVLLQNDKGSGIAGAFGGMGSTAAFSGAGAATFVQKLTGWTAVAFMAVVVALGGLALNHDSTGQTSQLKKAVHSSGLGSVLPEGLGDLKDQPLPQSTPQP